VFSSVGLFVAGRVFVVPRCVTVKSDGAEQLHRDGDAPFVSRHVGEYNLFLTDGIVGSYVQVNRKL
jgi:hypothetical protein